MNFGQTQMTLPRRCLLTSIVVTWLAMPGCFFENSSPNAPQAKTPKATSAGTNQAPEESPAADLPQTDKAPAGQPNLDYPRLAIRGVGFEGSGGPVTSDSIEQIFRRIDWEDASDKSSLTVYINEQSFLTVKQASAAVPGEQTDSSPLMAIWHSVENGPTSDADEVIEKQSPPLEDHQALGILKAFATGDPGIDSMVEWRLTSQTDGK